jgi:membrane associated rhomboid family serine protease
MVKEGEMPPVAPAKPSPLADTVRLQRPVMGIYDRDYYRRDGHSFLGSFTERGTVCKWLIGINIVCFLVQIATRPMPNPLDQEESGLGWFTDWFVLEQSAVFHGQLWRLITYAFMHSPQSVMHIFFNMLFLWWFGSDVEDLYGPREFLAIYLVSALIGGILYVLSPLANLGSMMPCLGASGAVTAVLVLCAFHFPTRIIYLFMFLPVPIWLFVIFEVAQDAYTYLGRGVTGTAVGVHLGGAAFAAAYYKFHWRLTNLVPQVKAWKKRRSQPRLRVYREAEEEHATPVAVTSAPAAPSGRPEDEQLEAKMDAVLEKISRFGKENLNDSDREVLRLAAEAIKRRRT